ncbi:MAG: hypothetical protein JWQ95_3936 [Sphaerisporangium sp.]|nr:hypothetical protein [Sphaerisporangium sp.]
MVLRRRPALVFTGMTVAFEVVLPCGRTAWIVHERIPRIPSIDSRKRRTTGARMHANANLPVRDTTRAMNSRVRSEG